MTATMANVDEALKDDYQPAIREQLRDEWMLLSQIESNSTSIVGREAVLSLHVGRNSGVGARAAGAALPAAGSQSYAESRVAVTRNYARMAIHGDLIEASNSDKGAFGRMLDLEMKGALRDLKSDVSRQIFNDSTKSIAQCGTTTASTTVVLTSPTNIQLKQFHVGMKVDIGTTALFNNIVANAEITAVDRTNGTITIDSAVTTTNSHYVTRAGSQGNELTGLRQIVDSTGTVHGVNPSTYPDWVSVEDSNSGTNRTPTEALIGSVLDDVHFESNEEVNLIVTTRGVRNAFVATLTSQKRFTNTLALKGGFEAITISSGNISAPIVIDNDNPANTMFLLNTANLTHYQMGSSWSFMDRDGSTLHYVPGYDQYEAVIYNYHQLATDRRNAHGKILDLTEV